MGLKPVLIFIPLGVMLVAIAVEAGIGGVGGSAAVCINNQGQATCANLQKGSTFTLGPACAVQAFISGIPSGDVYVMACGNSIGNSFPSETMALASKYDFGSASRVSLLCAFGCNVFVVPVLSTIPTITFGSGFWATCGGSGAIFNGGSLSLVASLTCTASQDFSQGSSQVQSGLFSFAAQVTSNSNGWVAIIITAIGIAVIAGFGILSSGLNDESTHILWIGGLLVAMWLIVIAAEGYPGTNEIFFNSIDTLIPGAGAATFLLLTMIYATGVITSVSRGV